MPVAGGSRLVAAVLAVTTTASLLSALVLAFDGASSAEWLAATPAVLGAVENCDALSERADRQVCKQQLVADHHAAASAPRRLAKR